MSELDEKAHIERLDAIMVELWAAKSLDLHMCDGTVKADYFGLLRDIRESWHHVRSALAAAHAPTVSCDCSVEELARRAALAPEGRPESESFQKRVHRWIMTCFSSEIVFSRQERNHRFLEEALELVQALGCTREEADQLVAYVYDRKVGAPMQEAGGVLVCLAALCTAAGLDMDAAGENELARIWTKIEQIRAKHAAKPQFGQLSGHAGLTSDLEQLRLWIWEQIEKGGDDLVAVQPTLDFVLNKIDQIQNGE